MDVSKSKMKRFLKDVFRSGGEGKTRKDLIGLRRNSYVCIHMYHEHFYIYVFYVSHRLLRTREPRVCAYTFAYVM